jgi:hypothetical protein
LDPTHADVVDEARQSLNAALAAVRCERFDEDPKILRAFISYEINRALTSLNEIAPASLSLIHGGAA